jgi:hypothetical protein
MATDRWLRFLGVWTRWRIGSVNHRRLSSHQPGQGSASLTRARRSENGQPSIWQPAGANTQVDEVWFSSCHTNIGGE